MMEALLAMQPAAQAICIITGIFGGVGLVVWCTCGLWSEDPEEKEQIREAAKRAQKILAKITWGMGLAFLLTLPPACSKDTYKNLIIYRAIESPTASKAVDTLDKMLDRFEEMLEKDK